MDRGKSKGVFTPNQMLLRKQTGLYDNCAAGGCHVIYITLCMATSRVICRVTLIRTRIGNRSINHKVKRGSIKSSLDASTITVTAGPQGFH